MRKPACIRNQHLFFFSWSAKGMAAFEIDSGERGCATCIADYGDRIEDGIDGFGKHLEHRTPPLVSGGIAPVEEKCEKPDHRTFQCICLSKCSKVMKECRETCIIPFSDLTLQIGEELLYGVSGKATDNISNVVNMKVWNKGPLWQEIRGHSIRGDIDRSSEFVRAGKRHFSWCGFSDGKDERATVCITSSTGVPVVVSYGAKARVFFCEVFECCVDSLFFRADQPDLHVALLQGKDLWPEHGRVGDADKLE